MIRDDDPGRAGPVASQDGADELDPLLVRAFGAAFDRDLPVDVEARHLWQLYRSARPSVIDGLAAAPHPGRLQRVLARVAITAMVTLMPSVLAAASADALPGDVLYPVKRHHQLAQVELAITWTERDAALAQLAELRLDEARAVAVSRPRAAARVVGDAAAALEELERSPLPTGSLQARRMRDAAAREVAALLDDVADPDRRHLQVAFEELSDSGSDSPLVASAQLPPGADEQRSATLRRRQPREPSATDAARSAAPATPGPAGDDRQLLARAPDDDLGVDPDAARPQPSATPTSSRPASAPADAVATAPRPAVTAPAAMTPTAPPAQQPSASETETEDPPPTTDEPASEPTAAPTVDPEPATEPSEDEDASRPSWALPRFPSPSPTVNPEPTAAPSPEPTAEPTPGKSPANTAEPAARASERLAPLPSEQPTKAALPVTKNATKAWRSGPAGRGLLAPSDAPAATEAP